ILGSNKVYQFQDWKLTCGGTQLYNMIDDGGARAFSYSPLTMAPPVGSGAPSGCSWACWKRLTAGQMLPLCSYGEQMENRSADVADGVRRSVSRPGGVRPLPRREA